MSRERGRKSDITFFS